MSKIDHYLHAGTRDNTRVAYQSAVRHYEVEWGGFLPATSENITQYLVDNAEKLAINTLRQRLAALAQWHIDQPNQSPLSQKSTARHTKRASSTGKTSQAFSA